MDFSAKPDLVHKVAAPRITDMHLGPMWDTSKRENTLLTARVPQLSLSICRVEPKWFILQKCSHVVLINNNYV